MPDVYSAVAELDEATQKRIAEVLEARGADPQQRQMRRVFLDRVPFPEGARVLEVGCGTGVLVRTVAARPGIAEVVGVDPGGSLIRRAEELGAGMANVSFREADGRELPFEPESFDVVLFDSTLCHMPGAERGLAEAFRVLRPGGALGAFDGDYATTTVAVTVDDPLQACVRAMMAVSVNDRYLVRRLPALVRAAGFEVVSVDSYGFVDSEGRDYMLSIIDRGADTLAGGGHLSAVTAAALKAEARDRAAAGRFFGHIAYGSVIARKP
jgi:ubiquinone/menaquinone biosynthesis C-methylase UbiE